MKLRKKIISILSATACTVSLCIGSVSISAETKSDLKKYDDYLSYRQVDKNDDGTFDYIEISECDKSAEKITIPDKIDNLPVTSIGINAFAFCQNLTDIKLPNSLTSIKKSAFPMCTSLTNIEISNSVTSIGDDVFEWCTSLKSIDIPGSVTSIGDRAFFRCTSLTSINVSNDNEKYSSIDGVLFNKNKTRLVQYPEAKKDIEYSIPDSVISIGDDAFVLCENLTNVKIPKSVTSIEEWAFSGCVNITNIEIPDSVTAIENYAFEGCTNLAKITILNPYCDIYSSEKTINNGYDNNAYYFNGTVCGYDNSTAQQFANKYKYKFESLGEKPFHIKGDANDDGKFNIRDAAFISIACAKGLYDDIPIWADYNDDGKRNIRDAAAIAIYLASR